MAKWLLVLALIACSSRSPSPPKKQEAAKAQTTRVDEPVLATPDPESELVDAETTLAVRVVRAGDLAPIANVRLGDDWVTNADGIAKIRQRDLDGPIWLRTYVAGYAPQRHVVELGVTPGVTIDYTITLHPATSLEGVVLDEAGAPVPNARVKIDAPEDVWSEDVEADATGKWRFEALGPGRHAVRASSDSHLDSPPQIVELGTSPRTGVVLRVQLGAEVEGVVVDRAGRPVHDITVRASWGRTTTNADGTFAIRGLDPGDVEVRAESETLGSRVHVVRVERAKRAHVELVVEPSSIAGVVRDANGPVFDAFVRARSIALDQSFGATTDENGKFDMGGLPPGTYELQVDREDAAYEKVVTVTSPVRDVAIVIPAAHAVTGRVVLDGRPVPYFALMVVRAGEEPFGTVHGVQMPDGAFLRELADGAWDIHLAGPTFETTVVRVDVRGGFVDLGEIAVERGPSITGRVVDDRGEPIANALVAVHDPERIRVSSLGGMFESERSARTDAAGRYRIDGIDATRELHAKATHARGMSRTIITKGARTLDFSIPTGGSIVGRIDPMPERMHFVRAKAGDSEYDVMIDSAGGFALRHLPPDIYEVTVTGPNDLAPIRVTVEAGKEVPLVIAIPTPDP